MQHIQPQYLSDKALTVRYSVSRATVWRWTKENHLPKPVKFNGSTRWKLDDLLAWEVEQGVA